MPPISHLSEDSDDSVTDKNFEPNPSDLGSSDEELPLKRLKTTAGETEQHKRFKEVRFSKQNEDLVLYGKF